MSKFDKVRVKFVIEEKLLSSTKLRALISRVFGKETFADSGDCTIKCPASMFAIFLVERHRIGISNLFGALQPELIIPEELSSDLSPSISMNYDIDA